MVLLLKGGPAVLPKWDAIFQDPMVLFPTISDYFCIFLKSKKKWCCQFDFIDFVFTETSIVFNCNNMAIHTSWTLPPSASKAPKGSGRGRNNWEDRQEREEVWKKKQTVFDF